MDGWMRLGNRVNEGYAELSVCLYLPDGRVACQFGRPEIEGNDTFEAGGLRSAVSTPFEHLEMGYEGELLVLEDPSVLRDPKRMFETAPRTSGSVRFDVRGVSMGVRRARLPHDRQRDERQQGAGPVGRLVRGDLDDPPARGEVLRRGAPAGVGRAR
jgi:hypothetical protein